MIVEVLSSKPKATEWIVMGIRRGINSLDQVKTQHTIDEICIEVAKDLGFEFERKENDNLYFRDTNV